jgi:hypothetical protein
MMKRTLMIGALIMTLSAMPGFAETIRNNNVSVRTKPEIGRASCRERVS